MNKVILVSLILIAMLGASIAGGIITTATTTKDIEIVFEPVKGAEVNQGILLTDLNNINYKYACDNNFCTATLTKKGLFDGHEIMYSINQKCLSWIEPTCIEYSVPECLDWEIRPEPICLKTELTPGDIETGTADNEKCIEWEAPKGCIDFDSKTGECLKWESELKCNKYSEIVCLKETERTCETMSKTTVEEFTKQAIQKELEFISGVYAERKARIDANILEIGKVLVK